MGCCCSVPKKIADTDEPPRPPKKGRLLYSSYSTTSSSGNASEEEDEDEDNDSKNNFNYYLTESENQGDMPQYYSFKQYIDEVSNPTLNGYKFLKEIGNGAMSSVYLAQVEETQEEFAAKVYNLAQLCKPTLGNEESPFTAVEREIELMSKMSHLYILGIVDAFDHYDTNSRFLFFPFAENGTLQSVLDKQKISEKNIAVCFHQIAVGLQYMHSINLVHRDIKPENILCFAEDYYVLSDFSVSAQLKSDNQMFDDTKGSPAFLSPEECSGDAYYPKPTDVWAYGVSLYSAVFGILPFRLDEGQNKSIANTVMIVTEMLETQPLTFPKGGKKADPDLMHLLKDVLNKDPKKRPTFEKIERYPYFKDAWAINEAHFLEEQQLKDEEEEEN